MARGLGKGFDSILPANVDVSKLLGGVEIRNLDLSLVIPNPKQPRRTILQNELEELASSMKAHGVLQPILVVRQGDEYVIVAGERRWRAANHAGLKVIPSIIRTFGDLEQLEVALIENVQRVELSPIEAAESIRRLKDDFGKTYEQIAVSLGKSRPTIVNIVRLLNLPEPVLEALAHRQISEGHARCFLPLKDNPKAQAKLLDQIITNGWSVRRAERFAQDVRQNDGQIKSELTKKDYVQPKWTKTLSKKVDAKVEIKPRAGKGGYVKIVYRDPTHLEQIVSRLE